MGDKREVRVQQIPKRFAAGTWETEGRPLVRMGDVGVWTMVRRADFRNAMPFVISRKDWDKLPLQEGKPDE